MRKVTLLFLTLITAMMLVTIADADLLTSGSCGTNLTYQLDTDGTLTVSGTGKMDFGTLNEIPWEDYRDSIKKVVLEDGVESIDASAFSGCVNMSSITVPESVTEVWSSSFYNTAYYNDASNWIDGVLYVEDMLLCDSSDFTGHCTVKDGTRIIANQAFTYSDLASITIPSSVEYIGDSAFSGCKKLESITIPEGVRSLGRHVFYNCDNLVDIKLPDSLSYIGFDAFYGTGLHNNTPDRNSCEIYIGKHLIRAKPSGVTKYTVRQGTRTISPSAFAGSELTSITIPDSVVYIGEQAFLGCAKLKKINIPDTISEIYNETFFGCESLPSLIIPDSVLHIGDDAFNRCEKLESITLSKNLKSLGRWVFKGCYELSSIYLPDSLEKIGMECFYCCYALSDVRLSQNMTVIPLGTFEACSSLVEIDIPETVTVVAGNAFRGCSSLTSVEIPENATLGGYAFELCRSLKSVKMPKKLEYINMNTFFGCESLESIVIPDGVKEICNSAFNTCKSLKEIVIPQGVTKIGARAFADCPSLQNVTIPSTVTTIGSGAFDYANITNVYISDVESWCNVDLGYYVGMTASPLCYADNLFVNGVKVTELVIPDTVEVIKAYNFCRCDFLNAVFLPETLTTVEKYAFNTCVNLSYIVIPSAVTTISDYAIDKNTVIYGLTGSTAQAYAEANGNTFIPLNELELTVSYNLNGGNGTIDGAVKKYGESYTVTSVIPEKENEKFLGWSTSPEGRLEYMAGDTCTVRYNVTLYAVWAPVISLDEVSVVSENTIDLPIEIKNNCGLKKLSIGIAYTDAFELLSVATGDALSSLAVTEIRDTNTVYLTFEGNEMDYNGGVLVTLSLKAKATDEKVTDSIKVTVIEAVTLNGADADISDATAQLTVLPFIPGDISGDGVTDLKDITNLRRYLAGGYSVEVQTKALDVNRDGEVDLKDVTYLRRYLAGGYDIVLQ